MRKIGLQLFVAGLAAAGLGSAADDGNAPAFDHQDWSAVLSRFVDERGRVDYEALARDRENLDRYLTQIAEIGPQITIRNLLKEYGLEFCSCISRNGISAFN